MYSYQRPQNTSAPATSEAAPMSSAWGNAAAAEQLAAKTGQGYGGGPATTRADTRLKHQTQSNSSGGAVDPEQARGRLPYNGIDAGSGWNGATILEQWSQVDTLSSTDTDENRCAANAVLASRIMAGPTAVHAFDLAMFKSASAQTSARGVAADEKKRIQEKVDAAGISDARITAATGTYDDLSVIADAAKHILTNDPNDATVGSDGKIMAGKGASVQDATGKIPSTIQELHTICDEIKPGEAWLVQVDTDQLESGQQTSAADLDHYITIGRTADASETGTVYLYDPWPRQGKQKINQTERNDFDAYFLDASGKMRHTEFLSLTAARHA